MAEMHDECFTVWITVNDDDDPITAKQVKEAIWKSDIFIPSKDGIEVKKHD